MISPTRSSFASFMSIDRPQQCSRDERARRCDEPSRFCSSREDWKNLVRTNDAFKVVHTLFSKSIVLNTIYI